MYIKQIANTLRTFGECSLNTHEMGCEHSPIPHVHHEIGCEYSANSPRPPRNWLRNTPPIPHVHHEIGCKTPRQFPTSTMKLVAKHSAKHQRTPTKLVANTPSGVGADSSCPYPDIAKNAYSHYQIRVYSLSNMHIHIIKYVFSSHHAHIFALPYQYIRFLLSIILNIKQSNTAYIYT